MPLDPAVTSDVVFNILLITLGGVLISLGVHFVPVGGAPAAMAQATGIGTGTVELAAGSGLTGLLTASYMYAKVPDAGLSLILAAGAAGSMIMIASTMFCGALVYTFGVGVPPASAQVKHDPLTGSRQDLYISKGTQGHGIPTVSFVSGVIGAALGGVGGSLVYYVLIGIYNKSALISSESTIAAVAVAGAFAIGVFYVNAVLASYAVGGTIEGFHDPKFRRVLPKAVLSSLVTTLMIGVIAVLIGGMA